ncbi:hypothetical protein AB0K60_09515 [Thermopolyspora sp. NPDC052614]|uniref:hypothetical protein n=1 Tax=Thermopolyspora sp. NPDC052614 TaxID=3155682 RepID=UPI003445D3F5
MTEPSPLEELPSRELHDRAIAYAVRHGDIGFLWDLLRAIPAAQAAGGHTDEAAGDLSRVAALLSDAIGSGEGELGEALRPVYLDYLSKHPDA